jgi:siroheme synthase
LKKQDIKENNMQGKIYGIGVGPGDPELMTLKAVRLIREADVIAIPGKEKETCTAYQIALGAVPEIDEKEIIPVVFPMTKNETVLKESHETAVKSLSALMDQGKTIAFLILGDVTVYSTYGYVHKKLLDLGYESVLVNGVPSFCAAAAKLGREGGVHPYPAGLLSGEGWAEASWDKDLNEIRDKDRGCEAGASSHGVPRLDGGKLWDGG